MMTCWIAYILIEQKKESLYKSGKLKIKEIKNPNMIHQSPDEEMSLMRINPLAVSHHIEVQTDEDVKEESK